MFNQMNKLINKLNSVTSVSHTPLASTSLSICLGEKEKWTKQWKKRSCRLVSTKYQDPRCSSSREIFDGKMFTDICLDIEEMNSTVLPRF